MASERFEQTMSEKIAREKADLLAALAANSGIVASACRAANVSRMTYYRYYNEDPDFKEKADDVKELQKDFAESLILKKMKEGDTTMIIFYAKTQMKDRGYVERRELVGKDGDDLVHKQEIDLSKLTEEQRAALLSIGLDVLNKTE
jgi:hypothetical protein